MEPDEPESPSLDEPESPSLKYEMLAALIYKWARESGQTSFGLQTYIEGFQQKEYRFWFTSGSAPIALKASWRYACMLQTCVSSLENQPAISVEQSCALTPEANACYDLADKLVKGDYIGSFLDGDNPMPAVRLDCGFDYKSQRAFLNEMGVSPGAWLFSECHKLDILCHVAKHLVRYMKPHLVDSNSAAGGEETKAHAQ